MKAKRLMLLLTSALVGGLLALPQNLGGDALFSALEAAGLRLRELSLSGVVGNLAAWCIVYALCAPPVVGMALRWRNHSKSPSDLLAPLSSLLIFGGLFALVNPTLLELPSLLRPMWPLAFWTAALSVLVCWAVLLALSKMERGCFQWVSSALSRLLTACAVLLALSAGHTAVNSVLAQLASISTSEDYLLLDILMDLPYAYNTRNQTLLWGVLSALNLIPTLLGGVVLLWGADLAWAIQEEPFRNETVALCGKTAQSCRRVAAWSALLCVGANLLQLAALPHVAQTSFTVRLPLVTLLLSAVLFLLCRCFQRGYELQEDSDSII